jgi:hypothetical protein
MLWAIMDQAVGLPALNFCFIDGIFFVANHLRYQGRVSVGANLIFAYRKDEYKIRPYLTCPLSNSERLTFHSIQPNICH